jgi:hypothetical protein
MSEIWLGDVYYQSMRMPSGTSVRIARLSPGEKTHFHDLAVRAKRELDEQGFTCVPNFFSRTELVEVDEILGRLFARFDELRAPGSPCRDWVFDPSDVALGHYNDEQRELLNVTTLRPQLLTTAVFRKICFLAAAFHFNRFCFDHAILKLPRGSARTPWHQDAQYVDPRFRGRLVGYPGYHFWIPFQDTTKANGCVEYIAGSHRAGLVRHDSYQRGVSSPGWVAKLSGEQVAVACSVPLGGIAIHTPLTLHGAGTNDSSAPRLAWILKFDRVGLLQVAKQRLAARVRPRRR